MSDPRQEARVMVGALVYEVMEYLHEYPSGSELFGTKRPESIVNAVTDVAVFWVGYLAGQRLRA